MPGVVVEGARAFCAFATITRDRQAMPALQLKVRQLEQNAPQKTPSIDIPREITRNKQLFLLKTSAPDFCRKLR
jgi:hypothetical protein